MARGTLSDLLDDSTAQEEQALGWGDPLLRLAQDLARGMTYLHQRQYYDERDGKVKRCIIHRDLKSENALVTDFLSAKLTDFGTSRAKGTEDVTMTAVGTPLFVAPEIVQGESYNESVDCYSFGMTLLDMATDTPILGFIGEQWCRDFGKAKAPKQPMRMIRKMQEEGWRPVTALKPISFAPTTINSLIVRCCAPNPGDRPTFPEILDELNGVCKVEIDRGAFGRRAAVVARRSDAEDAELGELSDAVPNTRDDVEAATQTCPLGASSVMENPMLMTKKL